MPKSQQPDRASATPVAELPLLTMWYRFMFFGWLFRDLNTTPDLYERHAALQHNRRMRRYLPTYLRRWSFLTGFAFSLGLLCERAWQASMLSACFFTWSRVTLTGMVVISVTWAGLASARLS